MKLLLTTDPMMWVFIALVFVCLATFCYGMWTELGRTGRRVVRFLNAWYRSRRGDVLNVAFLAGTFLLSLGYAWLRWILTHTPE